VDHEIEVLNPDARSSRKAWRHLIKHIYEVDPLVCRRCGQEMKIVSIIDRRDEIERILRRLGMWSPPMRPPGPRPAPPPREPIGPRTKPRGPTRGWREPPCDDACQLAPWNEEDFSQVPQGWDEVEELAQVPAD